MATETLLNPAPEHKQDDSTKEPTHPNSLTSTDPSPAQHTYGEINFLTRDPLFDTEKPYSMRYPPQGDLKQRNLITEKHRVKLESLRGRADDFDFDACGFGFMRLPTRMQYEDFDHGSKIGSVYADEICHALKARLGARHVHVMDYAVRKRHRAFPISTGENYKNDQPTSIAHIDFTVEEGERMLRLLYGDRADEVMGARWQIVNVWRSISGTVEDWPLGVCDARTMDATDAVPADIVYPTYVTENMQIHYNEKQQWYYMPGLEPDECWIFKGVDSLMPIGGQCPHSAFADPQTPPEAAPRESIDCRCFVLYADLDKFPPIVGKIYEGESIGAV